MGERAGPGEDGWLPKFPPPGRSVPMVEKEAVEKDRSV